MAQRPTILNAGYVTRFLRHSQRRYVKNSPSHASKPSAPDESSTSRTSTDVQPAELELLFAEPTWSVQALLPTGKCMPNAPDISAQKLHHLLRLSGLPPPTSLAEEERMLQTLQAQLHFVGNIQRVDTTNITPLRALRDETKVAEKEQTVTLASLRHALSKEKIIGINYKRIQRDPTRTDATHVEDWDVLGSAGRKSGRYFVVDSERSLN